MDTDQAYLRDMPEGGDEGRWNAARCALLFALLGGATLVVWRMLHALLAAALVPGVLSLVGLGAAAGALLSKRGRGGSERAPQRSIWTLCVGLLLIVLAARLWPEQLDGLSRLGWLAALAWGALVALPAAVAGWWLCAAALEDEDGPPARLAWSACGAALGVVLGAALLRWIGAPSALLALAALAALFASWLAFDLERGWSAWAGAAAAVLLIAVAALNVFTPLLEPAGRPALWDASNSLSERADAREYGLERRLRVDLDATRPAEIALPFVLLRQPDVLIIGAADELRPRWARELGAARVLAVPLAPIVQRRSPARAAQFAWASAAPLIEGGFDLVWLPLRADRPAERSGGLLLTADGALTRQGMRAALDLLKPDGILMLEAWPDDEGLTLGLLSLVRAAFGGQDARQRVFAVRGPELSLILVRNAPFAGGRDVGGTDALISNCLANGMELIHAHLVQGRDRFDKPTIKYQLGADVADSPSLDRPFFLAAGGLWSGAPFDPFGLFRLIGGAGLALLLLALISVLWTLLIPRSRSRAVQRLAACRSGLAGLLAALGAPLALLSLARALLLPLARPDIGLAALAAAALLGLAVGLALPRALPEGRERQLIKVGLALSLAYLLLAARLGPQALAALASGTLTWTVLLAGALCAPAGLGCGMALGAALARSNGNRLGLGWGLAAACLAAAAGVPLALLVQLRLGLVGTTLLGALLGLLAAFALPGEPSSLDRDSPQLRWS